MGKKHNVTNISNQTFEFGVPGGRHIRLAPRGKASLTDRECACYAVSRATQDAMLIVIDPTENRTVKKLADKTRKAVKAVYNKTSKSKIKEKSGRKAATTKRSKAQPKKNEAATAKSSPARKSKPESAETFAAESRDVKKEQTATVTKSNEIENQRQPAPPVEGSASKT